MGVRLDAGRDGTVSESLNTIYDISYLSLESRIVPDNDRARYHRPVVDGKGGRGMNMSQSSRNACILIVDDTVENIQVLGGILRESGFEINVARNGRQALDSVAAIPPDLILLDIMMPVMDGFETCTQLKANAETRGIPVIFLTAKTETEDIVRGFQIGAVDYIVKPFNPEELLVRVNTHLDLKFSREIILRQNAERQELIHILCHDLTNPISFIAGMLQIADDRPEILIKKKDLLVKATNNCLNIIELVRRMRALEEGKLGLRLTPVDLNSAVTESMLQLQQRFDEKRIEAVLKLAPSLMVRADRTSLVNSVLNNILTNALKFSYPGTKIIIEGHRQGQVVQLTVTDSGIGMSPKLLQSIFELGVTTSREGTSGENGTGFGMPLIKKFVTAYGGTIEVSSTEKTKAAETHGTQVRLVLPVPSDD
jgi:two-component system, sensor histidine kinase and response regulator